MVVELKDYPRALQMCHRETGSAEPLRDILSLQCNNNRHDKNVQVPGYRLAEYLVIGAYAGVMASKSG